MEDVLQNSFQYVKWTLLASASIFIRFRTSFKLCTVGSWILLVLSKALISCIFDDQSCLMMLNHLIANSCISQGRPASAQGQWACAAAARRNFLPETHQKTWLYYDLAFAWNTIIIQLCTLAKATIVVSFDVTKYHLLWSNHVCWVMHSGEKTSHMVFRWQVFLLLLVVF